MRSNKHNTRFRRGAFAMLFTVAVVLAVLAVNVVTTAISATVPLAVDMTKFDLFSVSDSTIEQLSGLEQQYTIHFCRPLDELASSSTTQLIYNCAQQFAAKMDNVTIDYLDIYTYPTLADKYKRSASDTVTSTDVIVENANGMYRKYTQNAFFVTENETSTTFYAFNGEFKFASAMLQLAGLYNPVAAFTTGHGEQQPAALTQLFTDAGYTVETVDLRTEAIDPYTKVIVVCDPVYDFIGANEDGVTNEINTLDDYMLDQGNLMIFANPDTDTLPTLYEYLEEWGIAFGSSVVRDTSSAASTDGLTVIATLPTEGLGASLHTDMRALPSQPIVVVKNCAPVYQLFTSKNNRTVSSVLTSTKSALAIAGNGDETRGQFDLMTLSRETAVRDDETLYSYVLACGSTDFCADSYMLKSSYGNRDILYTAMTAFNRDMVPIDISYKYFEDNSISINTQQANGWLIVMSVVIPAAVLIFGGVVFVRRRHL